MKNVLDLRPCQFVLGMREVQDKVKKIKRMTPKQRKKYISDHCVPVVQFQDDLYIVDHHHFVRACWETGIKKVKVRVIAHVEEPMGDKHFWKHMLTNKWTYLTDQFGRTNNDARLLPLDICGMADDPYRGLAWAAREAGGYEKMSVPFFEFQWANFLRKKIDLDDIREDFNVALGKAVKACKGSDASRLPGYKK